MQLIKDYKLRKLIVEYLHWVFTTGYERILAHVELCEYLFKNWDVYEEISATIEEQESLKDSLRLIMAEFITDNVFESLEYPVDADGRRIRSVKNTKILVDRFCVALEKLKPVLKKELDFYLHKEGGEHLFMTGRYRNLDKFLKELENE